MNDMIRTNESEEYFLSEFWPCGHILSITTTIPIYIENGIDHVYCDCIICGTHGYYELDDKRIQKEL